MSGFGYGPALLFCPADRPDRFAKALERADAVILDLEDAVAPRAKEAARAAVARADLDPARVIVRVSPAGTADFAADLAAVRASNFDTLMLAKTHSPADVDAIDHPYRVIALCETAAGIAAADAIAAHAHVFALMWGAEDLVASLGGTSSRRADGSYRDVARYARSRVLVAAGAAGVSAIDAVHLDIPDTAGLAAEAEDAAASGFAATACIHPSHVPVIRDAYRPEPGLVMWARDVLRAAADADGVFRHDGRMIDEPVLAQARRILARAATG